MACHTLCSKWRGGFESCRGRARPLGWGHRLFPRSQAEINSADKRRRRSGESGIPSILLINVKRAYNARREVDLQGFFCAGPVGVVYGGYTFQSPGVVQAARGGAVGVFLVQGGRGSFAGVPTVGAAVDAARNDALFPVPDK